jgi:hypothetical protein
MRTEIVYTRYAGNTSKKISVIFLSFLEAPRTELHSTAQVTTVCTRAVLVHRQEKKKYIPVIFLSFFLHQQLGVN